MRGSARDQQPKRTQQQAAANRFRAVRFAQRARASSLSSFSLIYYSRFSGFAAKQRQGVRWKSEEGARSQKDVSPRLAGAEAEAEAEAWRARFVNFCL